MIVREATEADIPEIVSLLKLSLGEALMQKSEAYWRWKHVENPFGRSPVLVAALESGAIIGVRAFMRWDWEMDGKVVKAVRAVDTATHPSHQGKGIFTKLTRQLLETCKDNGVDIVFNTPNQKSMPGYIKMGWKKAGNVRFGITIRRPFSMFRNALLKPKSTAAIHEDNTVSDVLAQPELPDLLRRSQDVRRSVYSTPHTVDSLRWRYLTVPVASYSAASVGGDRLDAVFFYRIKHTRYGCEFRLLDLFRDADVNLRSVYSEVSTLAKKIKADFVTYPSFATRDARIGLLSANLKNGPIVTVREVNLAEMSSFDAFNHWEPSLGDLELF